MKNADPKEAHVAALHDCPASADTLSQTAIFPARSLKIEAEGDPWKATTKPKIRLIGRWLERAGFRAGSRVSVRPMAPGVIELRSIQTVDETQPVGKGRR